MAKVILSVLFLFLITSLNSLGNSLPLIIEAHSSNKTKDYMAAQRVNLLEVTRNYTQAISLMPEYCRSKRFMEKITHIDSISGNNQDIALVLIQSLSLDIEQMSNTLVAQDPNAILKIQGILLAAKAHDNLLDGLKLESRILEALMQIP